MLTEPIEMCSKWKNISGSVESCIRNRVRLIKNGQMWRNLDGIINRCAGNLRDLLHVVFLLNKDDHKGFIGIELKYN